jgi:hypothetical protein
MSYASDRLREFHNVFEVQRPRDGDYDLGDVAEARNHPPR